MHLLFIDIFHKIHTVIDTRSFNIILRIDMLVFAYFNNIFADLSLLEESDWESGRVKKFTHKVPLWLA